MRSDGFPNYIIIGLQRVLATLDMLWEETMNQKIWEETIEKKTMRVSKTMRGKQWNQRVLCGIYFE